MAFPGFWKCQQAGFWLESCVSYCTSVKAMAPASRSSQQWCRLFKAAKSGAQGRGSLVLEKQGQSSKQLQEHNKRMGIANNWGVAGMEDTICRAWPDTQLASHILQIL